jgi:hypothetical protein
MYEKLRAYLLSRVLVNINGFRIGNLIYLPHVQSTRTYKQYSAIADLHNLHFTVTHPLGFSVFASRILVTELKQSHCD